MQQVQLYIQGQRIDLFNDETISVTQTLQNNPSILKEYPELLKEIKKIK